MPRQPKMIGAHARPHWGFARKGRCKRANAAIRKHSQEIVSAANKILARVT